MNSKTIKAVLQKKINDWADSIDNEKIKAIIKDKTIITGGCIASMLLKEDVKDYDIYFVDRESTLAITQYYTEVFNSRPNVTAIAEVHCKETIQGHKEWDDDYREKLGDQIKIFIGSDGIAAAEEYKEELKNPTDDITQNQKEEKDPTKKYLPVFLSSNAITLSNKIQLIIRFFGDAEEIHSNYDFVHCTNYYLPGERKLELKTRALECLLAKELIYQGSKYPICSVIRTRKFIKRGYHINAGQYLKMAMQISNLDLTDTDILEDQLCGVDSSYFSIIIDVIKGKKEKNEKIDSSYIAEVIDRVFN